MDVGDYLNRVVEVSQLPLQQQGPKIHELLVLDPQKNPYMVSINQMGVLTESQLNSLVEEKHLYNDEWLAFNELVISFIRLSNQLNAWSLLESFDLYTTFINDLSSAFNNQRGHILSGLVKSTINILIPMASKLDFQLFYKENCQRPRLTYLASVLLKIFNNIRSQLGDDNNSKKSIILFVGGKLCAIYFKLSNPLLCRNIFSNMNNANLDFHRFDANEQLRYRYYLGRFYLIKHQFVDAYQNLLWCLLQCPPSPNKNITNFLKHLIPVSIIIGKTPNFAHIQQTYYGGEIPQFLIVYSELYKHVRVGNFAGFSGTVDRYYRFLKSNELLLLMASKCKLILLRNLIKNIWQCSGRPSKLEYDTLKIGLRFALGDPSQFNFKTFVTRIDDDDMIENILIALIDQNLLRGKIFSRVRAVALSKSNAFVKIDVISFTRFGNGSEGAPNSNDRWMSR